MNLQNQIRQKLVDGIINGAFPPGMKLPSSRKPAQQLNVARNTVGAAYQQLLAGYYCLHCLPDSMYARGRVAVEDFGRRNALVSVGFHV